MGRKAEAAAAVLGSRAFSAPWTAIPSSRTAGSIKKHVAGGGEVCTMWDLELTKPAVTIPILEYFRPSQGKLVEIRPYYDPSPVTKLQ